MLRRAPSTALRTASDTSFAFPVANPTRPCPSPTATSALNEKRRPPFTTLATRLMAITFSTSSLPPSPRPPSRSRPLPSRPLPPRWPPSPRAPPPPPWPPPPPPDPRPRPAPPPPGPPRPPPPRPPRPPAPPPLRALPPVRGRSCAGAAAGCSDDAPSGLSLSAIYLKLQPALAGSVGHRFHAAVIFVSSSIEHYALHTGVLCLGGDALSNFHGSLGRLPLEARISHSHDRALRRVIHQLSVDVLERAIYDQPWTLRASNRLFPEAEVTARTKLIP